MTKFILFLRKVCARLAVIQRARINAQKEQTFNTISATNDKRQAALSKADKDREYCIAQAIEQSRKKKEYANKYAATQTNAAQERLTDLRSAASDLAGI